MKGGYEARSTWPELLRYVRDFDFCVLTNRCVHSEILRFNSNASEALDAMRIFLSSLLYYVTKFYRCTPTILYSVTHVFSTKGSGNVDPSGNFSVQVIRAALTNAYGLSLPNIRQQGALGSHDVTDVDGFICNKDSHWFAIRKINGRYWNLNSMQERPEVISHFRLAAEIQSLQDSGYSVFLVPPGEELPPECRASAMRERGLPQYWWREEDLVKGKSDAITGATDPWRNVGSGMRLDGRSSAIGGGSTGTSSNISSGNTVDVASMTEDEMLQMAMQASLETVAGEGGASGGDDGDAIGIGIGDDVPVPPEPDTSDKDAVRIQFRLPDGGRVVRRFRKADTVGGVYSFVRETSAGSGKLELRAGFPPVDLSSKASQTIDEAKLSGESIQCRYI